MDIDVEFTEKQTIAWNSLGNDNDITEVLFGGSAGGGKSYIGCAWLIINCITYPGTRWVMGRRNLKTLKETTLNTFFQICNGWKLDDRHYKFNGLTNSIKFFNGSVILLKDLFTYPSDPDFNNLGSLEITGAFIDEANQISVKARNILSSRIRYRLEEYGLKEKMFMTCNPAKNWVYDEFYKKDKEGTIETHKCFIPALMTDNPNISQSYIQHLERTLDPISKARLLYGQWEYEDGMGLIGYDNMLSVFDIRLEEKNVLNQPKDSEFYISCDVARKGKDNAVIFIWKGLEVIDSTTIPISLVNEIVDKIEVIKKDYNIPNRNIVVDGDGVGGGVVDYLPGCIDFVNNSKPLQGENYQNLKTQCYFKLAEKINNREVKISRYTLEEKDLIMQELSMVQRKNMDRDGKLQIMSKDEVKSMIGRSPDYSDALMMRMYYELSPSFFMPFVPKK